MFKISSFSSQKFDQCNISYLIRKEKSMRFVYQKKNKRSTIVFYQQKVNSAKHENYN